MTEIQKAWLRRILIGGLAGLACWVLVSWLTQPGAFFGGSMGFDFTFFYGSSMIPEGVGIALSGLLWFAFGAEIGVATLPFADEGKELLIRSLLHFAVMALTVSVWTFLNFFSREYPQSFFNDLWFILVHLTRVYVLIWVVRWVFWWFELEAIKEKLGLKPRKNRKEKSK